MNIILSVDLDTANLKSNVGVLMITETRGAEHYFFQYSNEWLLNKNAFSIDPALPLLAGEENSRLLWGAFQDISPDRWGQILQDKMYKNYLSPTDYMLGVSDFMRLGGIRLREQGTETYLAAHSNVPPLTDLRKLERAVEQFENDKITEAELELLIEPGSSMGGARPKAVVTDGETLYIAKFPSKYDQYKIINWEAVALELSKRAKINTANFQLLNKDGEKPILLVERFDREGLERRHFSSAKTLLNASINPEKSEYSYLELADVITEYSSQPKLDNYEMWKRMTFNALVCNTDDHMRNHGFLLDKDGWRLSPAYDINPDRIGQKMIHATNFDGIQKRASIELCMDLGEYFGLNKQDMKAALKNITDSINQFDKVALNFGLSKSDVISMEDAFKHNEMEKALSIADSMKSKQIRSDVTNRGKGRGRHR